MHKSEEMKKDDSLDGSFVSENVVEADGTNFIGGMFNVSNAALGAGLLTFPRSFATTEIEAGVTLQVVVSVIIFLSLVVIGRAAHLTATSSYPMILRRLLGKKAETGAICLLIFFAWAVCISYLQVIVSQMVVFGRIIAGQDDKDGTVPWYLSGPFLMIVSSSIVVFPAAFLKDMRRLSWVSGAAIAACWYIVLFVIITAIMTPGGVCNGERETAAIAKLGETPFFWRLLATFPAMCFGYQCHLSSVNNYGSLTRKAKSSYTYISLGGAFVCFLTYTAVGVAGNKLFGVCAGVEELVLDNYEDKDVGANVGRGFVALAVAFSYPVYSFTGRHELLRLFDSVCAKKSWEISENNIFIGTLDRRRMLLTVIWYSTTVAIACIPGKLLSQVINFIGTFSGFWMFVFPGLFALKLANLTHEGTIDAALASLPGAPQEEVCESWTNGMRSRVVRWLNPRERMVMIGVGVFLIVVGIALSGAGFGYFFYSLVQVLKS